MEVDFLINDEIAIEVKGASRVNRSDLKGLKALDEELHLKRKIVVCTEPEKRKMDDVDIVPIKHFLKLLWEGQLI